MGGCFWIGYREGMPTEGNEQVLMLARACTGQDVTVSARQLDDVPGTVEWLAPQLETVFFPE